LPVTGQVKFGFSAPRAKAFVTAVEFMVSVFFLNPKYEVIQESPHAEKKGAVGNNWVLGMKAVEAETIFLLSVRELRSRAAASWRPSAAGLCNLSPWIPPLVARPAPPSLHKPPNSRHFKARKAR